MNQRSKLLLISLIVLILYVIVSCKKTEQYSIIPHIDFKSLDKIANLTTVDDKALLTLSFTDGDGDIGLAEGDTLPPYNPKGDYYYDFFATYMERQNGILKEVPLPIIHNVQLTNNARLPLVTTSGSNKNIKGDIAIEMFINNPLSKYDTIAFQIYIIDRALHKSNVIITPDIIVKKR